jgi:N,N'-diacetyllegionaminate synthase
VRIADKEVGAGCPCFVIAEAGVNHNGDLDLARKLIDAAVDAKADAVKFQTFRVEELVTTTAPKAEYQIQNTGAGESQLDMVRPLELPPEAFGVLQEYCDSRGIIFISTPFDHGSVDVLAELDVPAFKVGSGELTNWPLLEHISKKGKPVILSTGMATLSEVDEALRVVRDAGASDVIVLHCVSNYPASAEEVNLQAMRTMSRAFPVNIGYSDHTVGIEIPIAAVALGATVIEKHFTLDKTMEGPDHAASLEPSELKEMISSIRSVEAARGDGIKRPMPSELSTAAVARRSLVVGLDIAAGTVLEREMIEILRPGTGIPPSAIPYVLGRRFGQDVPSGTVLSLDMFD